MALNFDAFKTDMSSLHPTAYRKEQRRRSLKKINRALQPILIPLSPLIIFGTLIGLVISISSCHPHAKTATVPAPAPETTTSTSTTVVVNSDAGDDDDDDDADATTSNNLIVKPHCDAVCYNTWLSQLELIRGCGKTLIHYDPSHHRKVVWLSKLDDHYRILKPDADIDQICREQN